MIFLSKERDTIDSCRFCWMCRHVCPIGNQTAKEINTPRGRALVLSTVLRGRELDTEIAQAVYECSLCGACTKQCVTGYDPTVFTRTARAEAAAGELIPSLVQGVIDDLLRVGNPFGLPGEDRTVGYRDLLQPLPDTADTLLFMGCSTAYGTPGAARASIGLLQAAGVEFTVLKEEECCGLYLSDLVGEVEESRRQALILAEKIGGTRARRMVVVCPSCTKAFKREYAKWGVPLPEVWSLTSYLAQLVKDGRLRPRPMELRLTLHDPCRLARDLEETAPMRVLLESMGVELKEMFRHGAETRCCGGALLDRYAPGLTALTSTARWQDAERTGAEGLVVACPSCQTVFGKMKPEHMALYDLTELLWAACGG